MPQLPITPRTTAKRFPKQVAYDLQAIQNLIDEALLCHIGFNTEAGPVVLPMACWRIDDKLYCHGPRAGRIAEIARQQQSVCITVTILDGIVLANSAFMHAMNYRSAMLFGTLQIIENNESMLNAIEHFMNHVAPNRWPQVRKPTTEELAMSAVFSLAIKEASFKFSKGPPTDKTADQSLEIFSGVIPIRQVLAL